MSTVSLELFEVASQPDDFADYLRGYQTAHGAFGLVVDDRCWREAAPGTLHVVLARAGETGAAVGGLRVHLRNEHGRLPTEINLQDPALTAWVEERLDGRPCEVAGLWVAPGHRATSLIHELFRGALAASILHRCQWLFGSTHRRLMPFYRSFGGVFDTSRVYAWPDERYQTYAGHIDLRAALAPGLPLRMAVEPARSRFALRQYHFVRILDARRAAARPSTTEQVA